ncbi:MAG: hypothetical protein IJ491_07410 [Clostridia bacterium]|nr:hypothetical protein [Clostridia bacterium]
MKIKNNSEFSLKPLKIIFCLSFLASVILRCLQMAKYIDPNTGFLTGGEFFYILMCIIIFGACAAFSVMSFLSRDGAKIDLQTVKSPVAGAATLVLAISLLYDSLDSLFSSFVNLSGVLNLRNIKELMSTGSLPLAIQSIFAFFSCIFFFIMAADFFKGRAAASRFRILALAPVGWTAFRLIHRFIRQISFVEVSDLFLELIMLGFMVIFFLAFAQVNSGIYSEGFTWRIAGIGSSAALIASTLSVSRLIFTFVNNGVYINPEHPFCFADFAFSIFALVLITELIKNIPDSETIETDTENEVV